MKTVPWLEKQIERALAFVHAALEDASPYRLAQARAHAEAVLPRVAALKPQALPLGDAQRLFEHVGQLRAVLRVLDSIAEDGARRERN